MGRRQARERAQVGRHTRRDEKNMSTHKIAQETVAVSAETPPTTRAQADASKGAAALGMAQRAQKYAQANRAGFESLCEPTAVMSKRKFDAGELKNS